MGGGGGDGSSQSSSSSASTSQTTSVADSYNETLYETTNIADSGNVGGDYLTAGDSTFKDVSGVALSNSEYKHDFGNITIGADALNTLAGKGGDVLSGITKYIPWIIAGFIAFMLLKGK